MKISTKEAVAFLVALGFTKASEWSEEKLKERLSQVPEKVPVDDVPKEHLDFYEELQDAKGQIEFSDGGGGKEDAKPEKSEKTENHEKRVKKAKSGKSSTKTDRAVDSAAKKKKEAAKPEKNKPRAKKESSGEPKGDADSIRAKIDGAITEKWQTVEEIAEASGVPLKQAKSRLRRGKRKGFYEVQHLIQYRSAK